VMMIMEGVVGPMETPARWLHPRHATTTMAEGPIQRFGLLLFIYPRGDCAALGLPPPSSSPMRRTALTAEQPLLDRWRKMVRRPCAGYLVASFFIISLPAEGVSFSRGVAGRLYMQGAEARI
jgi:hypothetical protein